jgi:hypothetical protein
VKTIILDQANMKKILMLLKIKSSAMIWVNLLENIILRGLKKEIRIQGQATMILIARRWEI